MIQSPLLLIGGAGAIGRQTAHLLRATYPEVPLLIGGRNLAKADAAAAEIGHAEGVLLDLTAPDLGLGQRPLRAVVIFYMDHTLAALRFAQ
ncbi:MAG: NAD(P)-dependent oxidoreductase, partial [Deltaproteobacteria bacterium]